MRIEIPQLSLVVLIGPSGSGKTTFARRHFLATEVLSSDYCRGLVSDNENDQAATNDAFEVLHFIAAKRLAAGRLTVVDATNVQPESRRPLVELARKYHCLPVAVVFELPEAVCDARNRGRPDRTFGPHVVRQQRSQLRRSLKGLPSRPFLPEDRPAVALQHLDDDVLDAADVIGKRIVSTRLRGNVTIREENAVAALEVMSRFAANPKWLIYLPPTMSPSETSQQPGLLEHPAEAFAYYRSQGCPQVVCEEKHMGSRAVVVVCRNEDAARQRFGIRENEIGIVYSRTGRRFFNHAGVERQLLDRIRAAIDAAGLWNDLETTWACLDCELLPWSAKAQELLRTQYAAVGSAGRASLPPAVAALAQAAARLDGDERSKLDATLGRYQNRSEAVDRFVAAYRRYCWSVHSLTDLKLAPFHLLATEGHVHTGKPHTWHMETLTAICREDPQVLLATPHKLVDVTDPASEQGAIEWWNELTNAGGEGMVVKPLEFIFRGPKGTTQPAVKCRGPEYLRIIYGPEYNCEENLVRLRARGLAHKRSLALREFALGIEGLERFVRREPLRRVHECAFGVLALESEPLDPRL